MPNARLDEVQAGIKITRRNINNLRYTDDTTIVAKSKEKLKCFLMKIKAESEKVDLKLNVQKKKINVQKTKILVSGLVPPIHGKRMRKQWEKGQTLFSWTPKSLQMVTAARKLKDACFFE